MDCREAEHLFDRYLDKEITVGDHRVLGAHLQACQRCAAKWRDLRKAVDLMEDLPLLDPGPEFLSRVMMTLPRAKMRRTIRLTAWQAAAAAAVAVFLAGAAFWSGSRQMIAAVVENQGGRTVVVPRPGQPLVIPRGATVVGDLEIAGDLYLLGEVKGRISADGRIVARRPPGFWERLRHGLSNLWRALTGPGGEKAAP